MSELPAKATEFTKKPSGGEPAPSSASSSLATSIAEKRSSTTIEKKEETSKSKGRDELQADHALRSSDPTFTRARQSSSPQAPSSKASTSDVKPAKVEPPKVAKEEPSSKNAKSAKSSAPSSSQATNVRRWFKQLNIDERRRVVSIMDEEMTELVLLMSLKLKNEGPGFFYEVGNADEVDLFAPAEVGRNRSNSLSHLPPYSPSPANTNNRQGRSLFRNAPSASISRRNAASVGVSAPGSSSSSRSLSQTREPIVRFRQPMRGVTSPSSGLMSSAGSANSSGASTGRARAASRGATPSSGPASLTSSSSSSTSQSKMTTSHSASSLSPSSSTSHVSTAGSVPKRTSSSSVADVLHRLGDECNSMPGVADAIHRLGDQFAKKAASQSSASTGPSSSAPSAAAPSSSSAPSKPISSATGIPTSSSSPSSMHVRASSASPSMSATSASLSSSSPHNVRSSGAPTRAPFPVRYFDDFFASDLIALNPYTPSQENFLFRRHCSLINTDSFTSATMRLEEELMNAVRLGDAKRYLDTITLSAEFLRDPSHFFNVMRVASRGAFLKKPCAMSWQAKDKSWVVSPPDWFERMGYYTFSTFIASQVEMKLWQGYYHFANIDPRRETGHFGSGSSKASAKVASNRHQDTLVSKSHLVDFWTKLSLSQKTDLIRSMGNMIEAKMKFDFTELSYPQLLHYMLKLTSVTHNVSNADNPLLQPNNEREFIDFIFLSPLRRAGTGVDLVLRRLGVFIETAYVDQQRADLILGEKMEKEKALSKGRHNKRKSKTVHSHTMPSSSDSYATKHNHLSEASSSGVHSTSSKNESESFSAKSAPASPLTPSASAVPFSLDGLATLELPPNPIAAAAAAAASSAPITATILISLPSSPAEPLPTLPTTKSTAKPEPIEATMSIKELTAAGFTIAGRRKPVFTRAKDDSAAPNQKKQPHADQVKAQAHRRSKDDTHSGTWTGPPKKSSLSGGTPASSAPATGTTPTTSSLPKAAPGSPKSKRDASAKLFSVTTATSHSTPSVPAASSTASTTAAKSEETVPGEPSNLSNLSPSSSSSSVTVSSTASTASHVSAHTAPSKLMQSTTAKAHPIHPSGPSTTVPSSEAGASSLKLSSDSLPAPTLLNANYEAPLSAIALSSHAGAQSRPLGMSDPSYANSQHVYQQTTHFPGGNATTNFPSVDSLDDLDCPPGLDHLSMGTTESSAIASSSDAQARLSLRSSGSSASSEGMSTSSAPPVSTVHFHQNQVYYTSSVRGKMHSHHYSSAHRHRDDIHTHQRSASKQESSPVDHHSHHETMSDRPQTHSARQHQQQLDSLEDRPHPTQKTRTMPSLFRSGPAPSTHNHNSTSHGNKTKPLDTPSIKSSLNANASPYYPAPSTFSPPRSAQMHDSSMRQSTPPGRLQGTDSWIQQYQPGNAPNVAAAVPQTLQPTYKPQWMHSPIEFGPRSADTQPRSVDDISTTPAAHSRQHGHSANSKSRHHHHHHHSHQNHQNHQNHGSNHNHSGNNARHGSPNKNTDLRASQDKMMPAELQNHPLAYTGVVHPTSTPMNGTVPPQGSVVFALPHGPLPAGAVMAPYILAASLPPAVPEEYRADLTVRNNSVACKRLQSDIEAFVSRVDSVTGPRTITVLKVVGQVQAAVDACFPGQGLVAEIYGSFSTRLGIPASDLDLVITCPRPSRNSSSNNSPVSTPVNVRGDAGAPDGKKTAAAPTTTANGATTVPLISVPAVQASNDAHIALSPREVLVEQLTSLYSALTREAWLKPEKMQLIDTASVPVIKLVCHDSDLPVDITMEDRARPHTGLLTRALTQQFCKEWPELRPLVLVLKQMIHHCNLHHIYTGGISSYFLTILVASYLQLYRHTATSVAGHLLNLLDLYGNKFNFQATLISIIAPGSHMLLPASHFAHPPQQQNGDGAHMGPPAFPALNIVDPLNPSQTVGQSVFGMPHIQMAFHNAYTKLHMHYIADGGHHAASTPMDLELLLTGISPLQLPP